MNIIISSSRSGALQHIEPLRSNHLVEVWSKPGGTYENMRELVDNHYILHHGGPPAMETQAMHFYIMQAYVILQKKSKNAVKTTWKSFITMNHLKQYQECYPLSIR